MDHECTFKAKIKSSVPECSLKTLLTLNPKPKFQGIFENCFVIVKNETDIQSLIKFGCFGSKISIDDNTILRLSLEEGFFLIFAINCIEIYDKSEKLSVEQCWNLFYKSDSNFIKYYIIYHHFRIKGWIVKSGEKFAGDYILYKNGPQFYHASYIVIIDTENLNLSDKKQWNQILPIIRVAETCKKEVIIARIIAHGINSLEEIKTPTNLNYISVHEMLVGRWFSSDK